MKKIIFFIVSTFFCFSMSYSNELDKYKQLFYEEEHPYDLPFNLYYGPQNPWGFVNGGKLITHPRMQKQALGRLFSEDIFCLTFFSIISCLTITALIDFFFKKNIINHFSMNKKGALFTGIFGAFSLSGVFIALKKTIHHFKYYNLLRIHLNNVQKTYREKLAVETV